MSRFLTEDERNLDNHEFDPLFVRRRSKEKENQHARILFSLFLSRDLRTVVAFALYKYLVSDK